MAVTLRPINWQDISDISTGEVNKVAPFSFETVVKGTVVDPELFGVTKKHREDKEKSYEDEYMRTASRHLTIPILNPFLAGRNAKAWKLAFPKYKSYIEQIVAGEVAYNVEEKRFYHINELDKVYYDREVWKIGGEILELIFDETDFEESFVNALWGTYILSMYSDREKEAIPDYNVLGVIEETDFSNIQASYENDEEAFVWLIGNRVFYPSVKLVKVKDGDTTSYNLVELTFGSEEYKEYVRQLSEHVEDVNSVMFDGQFEQIATMAAIMRNPQQLKGQILHSIFILPYGYRPTIDKRVDPLTKEYNRLIKLDTELLEAIRYQDKKVKFVLVKYANVVKHLTNLFIGDSVLAQYSGKAYKSLADGLGGKKGLMRDKLQSCRSDFTGRTVITSDPEMPVDMIGVPKNMIHKLCETGAITMAREDSTKDWDKRNRAVLLNHGKVQSAYNRYAEKYAKNMYFGIGRQPTLWNLGIQGFRVKPVDGNAFVLSPLVVEPFNADFDGDTMHGFVANSPEAVEELENVMASTNNLYYPKSGELTVVLRHEILYGLYMASAIREHENSRTYSFEQIEAMFDGEENADWGKGKHIYEAVCRNKIAIYDKVPFLPKYSYDSKDGYETAGVTAIKYILGDKNSRYAMGVMPLSAYGSTVLKKKKVVQPDGTEKEDWVRVEVHDKTLNKKWFNEVVVKHIIQDKQRFTRTINSAVKLGFAIAKIWPPSISTITDIDTSELVAEFNKKISEREELLNMGIEIESAYSQFFDSELKKLDEKVYHHVLEHLGADIEEKDGKSVPAESVNSLQNGYLAMMLSGAKGNRSNVMQIFGIKGRMQKDDVTSFNTIIGNSLSKGLTGLEGFITAYGARQGLADKVLSTAEPGYLSRKLEHAAAAWHITNRDCGTDDGIHWTFEDFLGHIETTDVTSGDAVIYQAIKTMVSKMFVGRYIIHNGQSIYIKDEASFTSYTNNDTNDHGTDLFDLYVAELVKDDEGNAVINTWQEPPVKDEYGRIIRWGTRKELIVRSPITCRNTCCQICYGKDLTTNLRYPRMGKPIGFIAAQSIGQPGTQLTMKNFQRGGVVSDANLTSSFDKIESYLDLTDLKNQKSSKITLAYDALSPVEGRVVAKSDGTGRKKIAVLNEKGKDQVAQKNFYVPDSVELKSYVNVGDSFQRIQGDLNICEVLKYRGFESAYKYFILILQRIFNAETYIDTKHFEVIIGSMCSWITYNESDTNTLGECLSLIEYNERLYRNNEVLSGRFTLTGLGALPKFRKDFFESMIMEDMKTYVPRAILMSPSDDMKNPKSRISFGQLINMGTAYAGYIPPKQEES